MPVYRGDKSIGMDFSGVSPNPPTLPPYASENTQDIIDNILSKLENLTTLVEGKADASRLKTLIQFSDELIRLQAKDVVVVGDVTFAQIERERTGVTSGTLPISITRIVGDVIRSGTILSNNWGPSEGTAIDLNNGKLVIGGSDSPKLVFEDGDLTISGKLTADSILTRDIVISDIAGSPTLGDIYDNSNGALTEDALAEGVGNILAGLGGDFQLVVHSDHIVAKHKDTNINGLGAGYSGTLRTGLLISSNGIGAGFNDKVTGDWVTSFTLDGVTGNISLKGTLTAGSVIANSVTVDGKTLGSIVNEAFTGADLQARLEESGSVILKGFIQPQDTGGIKIGTITWNPTTGALTGGSGIAITEAGLIGAQSGVARFTITAAGAATFSGTLSAASGTFSGNLSAAGGTFAGDISAASGTFGGNIQANGYIYITGGTTTGNPFGDIPRYQLLARPSNVVGNVTAIAAVIDSWNGELSECGRFFNNYEGSGAVRVYVGRRREGITAYTDVTGGVAGNFVSQSPGAVGLQALNNFGGTALNISGKIVKPNQAGDIIRVYNTSTNALVAEYRYEFA